MMSAFSSSSIGSTPLQRCISRMNQCKNKPHTHKPATRPVLNLLVLLMHGRPGKCQSFSLTLSHTALTLYSESCEPEPIEILHPSPSARPCEYFCSPFNQFTSGAYPAVGPYCSPSASALLSIVIGVLAASGGSAAERMAICRSVIGNDVGFGLPASREMTPGVCSSGNRPRTTGSQSSRLTPVTKELTGTGLPSFRLLGEKLGIVFGR